MLSLSEEILNGNPRARRGDLSERVLWRDAGSGWRRGREVRALFPLVNRRDDSPRNRFSVTPDDVRGAERAASSKGLELIGWYHSHPGPSGAAKRIRPRARLAVVQLRHRERGAGQPQDLTSLAAAR